MSKRDKLLAAMRANPNGDWTIGDIERVCRSFGIECRTPKRGSHHLLKHPAITGALTIAARRPIKAIYIMLLLDMIDALADERG